MRKAFWRAVEMLVDLGAEVEEVSVPLAPWARLIFYTHMYVEMPARYKEWVDERLTEFDYDQQVKLLTGSLVPGAVLHEGADVCGRCCVGRCTTR